MRRAAFVNIRCYYVHSPASNLITKIHNVNLPSHFRLQHGSRKNKIDDTSKS
jgi:hypothetical protein